MIDIQMTNKRLIGVTLYDNGVEGKSFVIRPGANYPRLRHLDPAKHPYPPRDTKATGAKVTIVESGKILWLASSDPMYTTLVDIGTLANPEKLESNIPTRETREGFPDILRGSDLNDPHRDWKR